MSVNQESKKAVVEEIKGKLQNAQSAVVVDYRGLTVEEVNALRKLMREANVDYKIYKNTLMNLAVQGTDFEEIAKVLEGPSAFAFGYDDAVSPARVLNGFMKQVKKMEFKAGIVEGRFYDVDGIKAIASLPSREELIAKLLGSFKAPMSNLVYMLQAIADNPEALNKASEKKEEAAVKADEPAKEAVKEEVVEAEAAAPTEEAAEAEVKADEPAEEAAKEEVVEAEEAAPTEEAAENSTETENKE